MRIYYKGYRGSIEYSAEDNCWHGHILHIRDRIAYEATDKWSLAPAFMEAVEDYIETRECLTPNS